ncbi:MAG: hypothetical protein GPOALKHO_001332 [Sodalis sp.]|uniref:hypothetical protein n=1 Tax=Sodalis sp. (in: enterobacteria) TaxID=1898979 RepID=UPI00387381C1|nr:MAG: hypothetical protein GPOALKHO_001332 [Sodalis sp.]
MTQTGAITTPIAISYILQRTDSFDGALTYVAANRLMVIVIYLFIIGEIQCLELKPLAAWAPPSPRDCIPVRLVYTHCIYLDAGIRPRFCLLILDMKPALAFTVVRLTIYLPWYL